MFDPDFPEVGFNSVAYLSGEALHSVAPLPVTRVRRPKTVERIALTDRAAEIVTDFTSERPVTVAEDRQIDEALQDMRNTGVRALLVLQGDAVTGLITSYDIQGQRPLQFLHAAGFATRRQIQVGYIMTPWDRVPKLEWQHVRTAQVGKIVEFFAHTRATHIAIVEYGERGECYLRGLISRTQLERQLGYPIKH
jgi:CBS domain-containing protein